MSSPSTEEKKKKSAYRKYPSILTTCAVNAVTVPTSTIDKKECFSGPCIDSLLMKNRGKNTLAFRQDMDYVFKAEVVMKTKWKNNIRIFIHNDHISSFSRHIDDLIKKIHETIGCSTPPLNPIHAKYWGRGAQRSYISVRGFVNPYTGTKSRMVRIRLYAITVDSSIRFHFILVCMNRGW